MITPELKEELDSLIPKINTVFDESEGFAAQAVGLAGVAIRERTKLGEMLNRAKKIVEHGNWLEWLGANCPRLTEQSAQRYMKLAKTSHVRYLDNCASVTEAYRLAGLLPPRDETEGQDDEKQKGDNYVVHISRALDVLNKAAVDGWQSQDKAQLRARLKPLVDLYDRLA